MSKSQAGRLGWIGLVNKQFDGDEVAAKTYMAQLGRYAYGLNYLRRGQDFDWYPTWVKTIFRQHPGKPADFMKKWCGSAVNDADFYTEPWF